MITTPSHPALAGIGRVVQIAFIPRDFDASLRYWTQVIGAGPFFHLPHIQLDNTRYRGVRQDCDISAALGYWGDVQIELVHQHDDAPSIYREWKEADRTGVHHLGIVVDDFDKASAILADAGGVPIQETEIPDATRAAYFEMPSEDPLIELLWLRPNFLALFDHMRRAAAAWDGHSDPLRAVPPPEEWGA